MFGPARKPFQAAPLVKRALHVVRFLIFVYHNRAQTAGLRDPTNPNRGR